MSDEPTKLPVDNKRANGNQMTLVPKPKNPCGHYKKHYLIDLTAQTCECGECGASLSPWFVLEQLMKEESHWVRNRDRYADEMKRLSERSRTKCQHCGEMTYISRSATTRRSRKTD